VGSSPTVGVTFLSLLCTVVPILTPDALVRVLPSPL